MSAFNSSKLRKEVIFWVPLWVIVGLVLFVWFWPEEPSKELPEVSEPRPVHHAASLRFAGFNNETGTEDGRLIVPNIVHFVVFEKPEISFAHFICVLAALKNQNPDQIIFHTNLPEFTGVYWQRLLKLKRFQGTHTIRRCEMPTSIYGQPIGASVLVFHGGDIARLRILMEFGGIYLDNDSYIVKSLDPFRKFEMAIGWDEGEFLGTQIIVAHKDARFLKLWLKSYDKQYDANRWYYNAGELPTTSILYKNPELVHRVKLLFGNKEENIQKLLGRYWHNWRNNYALHLFINHQDHLRSHSAEATYPVVFNEINIQKYPITFREMANEALAFENSTEKV